MTRRRTQPHVLAPGTPPGATVVAFHAHPDDEALLTGGTLARLTAEGHRVIVVVATDGTMGPTAGPDGQLRMNELRASAAVLGVARVHQVGAQAAELAGNVRVLEATVPRELVALFSWPLIAVRLLVRHNPVTLGRLFTPRSRITHRVSVHRYAASKRAALAAHQSQVGSGGRAARSFRLLVRLPVPAIGLLLGREWFAEPGGARRPATAFRTSHSRP